MISVSLVFELPELTAAIERLARLAIVEGIEFTTADFGGTRTEADTTRILGYRDTEYAIYAAAQKKAGKPVVSLSKFRPIATFGKSHHNYGAARDIRPTKWPAGKGFQWAHDRLDAIIESDPVLNKVLKIGDYFNDEPHVELRISLDEARVRYMAHVMTTAGTGGVVAVAVIALAAFLLTGKAYG